MTAEVQKCEAIEHAHVMPGWGCCMCRTYNGLQNLTCRICKHPRCDAWGLFGEAGGSVLIVSPSALGWWAMARAAVLFDLKLGTVAELLVALDEHHKRARAEAILEAMLETIAADDSDSGSDEECAYDVPTRH